MPPMAADEYRDRVQLSERQRVRFLGQLEPLQWPLRWPEHRRRLFSDTRQLGRLDFATFDQRILDDATEMPWRIQTKKRAIRLAHRAGKCRAEGKNERSWRASLESEALERFTVEVSCPTCRARLWRSEIEAATEASNAQALSLEERRERRMPCRCPDGAGQNEDFHGVNEIFSDRAETSIHYNPPLQIGAGRRKPKKYEQPDRVYGLNETRNFTNLLASTNIRAPTESYSRSIRDTIEASPFKGDRKPLLFPFLLLESKSGLVGDTAGAEMQSVFAVRQLLQVQNELRLMTGAESEWQSGPFVWFLTHHGEKWYIRGSFADDSAGSLPQYCILDLWEGNICNRSGALQLLTIVDYIFDWARDVYRPAILKELNMLAGTEMPLTDPDIFSTIQRRESMITSENHHLSQQSWHSRHFSAGTILDDKGSQPAACGDRRLSLGVVREVLTHDYRFFSLYLVPSNMEELTSSVVLEAAVAVMLANPSSVWRVTRDTLTSLEANWTGIVQPLINGVNDDIFFLSMVIESHVTTSWDMAHQITCFALSETALRLLLYCDKAAEIERMIQTTLLVEQSKLNDFLCSIKQQSEISKLTAAVNSLCLYSACIERPGRVPAKWLLGRTENRVARLTRDGSRDLVYFFETFQDVLRQNDAPRAGWSTRYSRAKITASPTSQPDPCLWPWLDTISQDKHGCVLIDSRNLIGNHSRYCLYVLSMSRFRGFAIAEVVESLSEFGLYYSTTQLDSTELSVRYHQLHETNSSVNTGRLWRTSSSLGLLKEWIEGLKAQPARLNGLGDTVDSPLVLSSDEESEGDGMLEDD
ncbi:hypothetical protein BJY04DRAFT_227141 [Aspergillus karnatakaensis]|uniref:uncharacterized protein n=1 Tax=Aspergillus karnatakaensis TaxID=1810916 RepID=UPI003CCE1FB9